MKTGILIKRYLESHGIAQAFLSKRAGIAPAKLSLALNGHRRITFDEYERICWALDVSPCVFIEPHAPERVS